MGKIKIKYILNYLDEHPDIGILIGWGFIILGGILMYLGFSGMTTN